jgi:hypothetical protein
MRRAVGAGSLNRRNEDHLAELLEAVFDAIVDAPLS